jgi:hypothetical protein
MDPHIHHRHNDEPLADELVSAYLDGEVTAAEQAQVEERMAVNPEFRQLVEELRGLRTNFEVLPQHRLPADFAERVLRRAEQEMLLGATDSAASNPAPVSPLVKVGNVDDGPSPDFDGEPVPITLPARPPVEERAHRRAGFRPFGWTLIATAAALLILITNRQPDVRDVPIAKSPEAERNARETADARGRTDTTAQPAAKESETAPDAAGTAAGRSISDSRESGRSLNDAEESKKTIDEAPALQPALPAPEAGKDLSSDRGDRLEGEPAQEDLKNGRTVPPVPMNARGVPSNTVRESDAVTDRLAPAAPEIVRSRSSAARGESRQRDISGRAAESRRPAPADEFRKDLRDAADDKQPLDVKASNAFSDSAEKREKADEVGARSSRSSSPAGHLDAPQPTGAEAGVEIQEQVGNALKREPGRKDSVEQLQEETRYENQPGQLSAATAAGEVLVIQVMLTPEAARQGAFDAVLAQNSIRLADQPLRRADEQETVLGAPAAGPTTAYEREPLERFGQDSKEARSGRESDQPKFHAEPSGRSARANVGGKQDDVPQTAPQATRNAPSDPSRAATSRGRNVRAQQQIGKEIQPAEPSLPRYKDQAAPENAVREPDADNDKKNKADEGTTLLADSERLYFERNAAASTDLDVVVVTASDEQINGTLAALQAQQDLFPSVHVASGLGLSALTVQQPPAEGKAAPGAAGAGLGGFGGGAFNESPIRSPNAFRRRLPTSGGTPAQVAPGAEPSVGEKLEKAKTDAIELSEIQKKEDAQTTTSTTNGALPRSAGGGEASGGAKYAPSVRLRAQPPQDRNGREALDVADAAVTGYGVARRMRLESVAEILRAQRQKQAAEVQFGATEVPATKPPKAELSVEAAETAVAKPADASVSQQSGNQAAQQRQRSAAERPQPLTKSSPADEPNEPAAADLKDSDLAPRDRESRGGREDRAAVAGAAPDSTVRLEGNLTSRGGGYRAPQSDVSARPAVPPQPQRQVLFVFRVAEPAIAGQSGANSGAGTVLRGSETAHEAAGEAQIERAPTVPAPPAPSRK